jgi:integrase
MRRDIRNPNHPVKGDCIRVEPIRSLEKIGEIKQRLSGNAMHYALFVIGINTNLRASDLIRITAGQVKGLQPMDELTLKEQKTGKHRRISLNAACIGAINNLLATREYGDEEPIFTGQRGVIKANSINRYVKRWCRAVGLRGNYGSHTLRKTFGYHQYHTFKVDVTKLTMTFNHSTQRQTCDYLGIQPEDIKSIYKNEL